MSGESQSSSANDGKESEELQKHIDDVMLVKEDKDEPLEKRPKLEIDNIERDTAKAAPVLPNLEDPIAKECSRSEHNGAIQQVISDIFQEDEALRLRGIQLARKLVLRYRDPPIDDIITAGIVNKCVEFLKLENTPILQIEAATVLINITAGTTAQTEAVIQAGAIPPLIENLKSPHADLVEESCLVLGNCIGDGPKIRDMIIDLSVIPPLIDLVNTRTETNILGNVAWTLSNIFRVKNPAPASSATKLCLPAIVELVNSTCLGIVSESCMALSYLSDGDYSRIQDVIDSGVVPRLVELLMNPLVSVVIPSLRTLGNIVLGTDAQTQVVINAGVLPELTKLLQHPKSSIVKEAAWTLSNIAAGTEEQISLVMDSGAIPYICELLETGQLRVRREAIWTVANITESGTVDHVVSLWDYDVVPRLCRCLNINDCQSIRRAMDALENILRVAEQTGQSENVKFLIEDRGGLDRLEQLQTHENYSVYEQAYHIIEQFFVEGSDGDNPRVLPEQDINEH